MGIIFTPSVFSATWALASRRMGRLTFVSVRKGGMVRESSSTFSAYTLSPLLPYSLASCS